MKGYRLFALMLLVAQPLGACKRKGIQSDQTGEGGSAPGPGSGGAFGIGGAGNQFTGALPGVVV